MRLARTLAAATITTALVAAPLAASQAATAATDTPTAKPKFAVTKLVVVGKKKTYDVTSAAAVVKVRVQVKDRDKKFDPATVKLVVVEKVAGTVVDTFTVSARKVGKSKVVSNWHAKVTVPAGSPAATYCLKVVKVDDASPATLPAVATAKGLAGRDCFVVTNTTV
jgi:plastocyanin